MKRYFWTYTFFLRHLAATKTPGAHSSLVFNPCGRPIYCCFHLKIFRIFSKKKLLLLPQMSDILWHQGSSKDTRYLLSRILVQWTLSTFFSPGFLLSSCLCWTRIAGLAGREEGKEASSLNTSVNLSESCQQSVKLWSDWCGSVMPCFPPIITISSCKNRLWLIVTLHCCKILVIR